MSGPPKAEARSSSGGALRLSPTQALLQLRDQAGILSSAEVEAIATAGLQQVDDHREFEHAHRPEAKPKTHFGTSSGGNATGVLAENEAALAHANEMIAQLRKDVIEVAHLHPRRSKAQAGLQCGKCHRVLQTDEDIFGDVLHIRSNHIFTATFIGWCLDCSARYGFTEDS